MAQSSEQSTERTSTSIVYASHMRTSPPPSPRLPPSLSSVRLSLTSYYRRIAPTKRSVRSGSRRQLMAAARAKGEDVDGDEPEVATEDADEEDNELSSSGHELSEDQEEQSKDKAEGKGEGEEKEKEPEAKESKEKKDGDKDKAKDKEPKRSKRAGRSTASKQQPASAPTSPMIGKERGKDKDRGSKDSKDSKDKGKDKEASKDDKESKEKDERNKEALAAGKTRHGSLYVGPGSAGTKTPVRSNDLLSAQTNSDPLLRVADRKGNGTLKKGERDAVAALLLVSPRPEGAAVVPEPTWTVDGERRILQWATLKQLIHAYASADAEHSPDTLALRHVALAHAHFVSSLALLDQLVKAYRRFAAPSTAHAAPTTSAQVRVVNMVKTWVELAYAALVADAACAALLTSFMAELPPMLSAMLGHAIAAYDMKQQAPCHHLLAQDAADTHDGPPEALERLGSSPALSASSGVALGASTAGTTAARLLDFEPLEVARQLALMDQQLLAAIPLSELHKKRWTTPESAPHIEAASMFSNKLAYWLAAEILREEKTKAQLKAFVHVVAVGKHLLALQDFQALFAVYLALNLKAVKALRALWGKLVPKKTASALKRIEQLNSPLDNFGGYRAYTKALRPPMVPCLEITLKDLLYQTDGSSDFHEEHVGVLNMLKLDSLGKVIAQLVACQLPKYCLRRHAPVYALLVAISALDKKDLIALTLPPRSLTSPRSPRLNSQTYVQGQSQGQSQPTSDKEQSAAPDSARLTSDDESDDESGDASSSSDVSSKELKELEAQALRDDHTRKTRTQPGTGSTRDKPERDDNEAHSDADETLGKRIGDTVRDIFVSPRKREKRARAKRESKRDEELKDRERDKATPNASPSKAKKDKPNANANANANAMPSLPTPPETSSSSANNLNAASNPASPHTQSTWVASTPSATAAAPAPAPAPVAEAPASPAVRSQPVTPTAAQTPLKAPFEEKEKEPERWAVVRKFEKRGGVKVRVPATVEALLTLGAAELGLSGAVKVREAATEAIIKSVDAIEPGAILWIMTPEDEANFD